MSQKTPAPGKFSSHGKEIISTDLLQDESVTKAKAKVFVSTEQTGTGSAQNVAHGLGTTPGTVLIAVTEFGGSDAVNVTEGTHDATNVVVTVGNGIKFKALAWA